MKFVNGKRIEILQIQEKLNKAQAEQAITTYDLQYNQIADNI